MSGKMVDQNRARFIKQEGDSDVEMPDKPERTPSPDSVKLESTTSMESLPQDPKSDEPTTEESVPGVGDDGDSNGSQNEHPENSEDDGSAASADLPPAAVPTQRTLLFATLQAAKDWNGQRTSVAVPADDDVDEVEADPKQWVIAILNAFDQDYQHDVESATSKKPEGWTQEQIVQEWERAQKDGQSDAEKWLEKPGAEKLREQNAWLLVEEAIAIHKKGHLVVTKKINPKLDEDITCSARLSKLTQMFKDLTRTRAYLVSHAKPISIEVAAACPTNYRKQRVDNIWSNANKYQKTNNKRGSTAAGLRDEEEDADEDVGAGAVNGADPGSTPTQQPSETSMQAAQAPSAGIADGGNVTRQPSVAGPPDVAVKVKYEGKGQANDPVVLD